MSETLHIDLLAERVLLAMEASASLQVVAVWESGSITTHPFSFWGRRLPNRTRDYPVATFVVSFHKPTVAEIIEVIAEGLEQRGWTAAS